MDQRVQGQRFQQVLRALTIHTVKALLDSFVLGIDQGPVVNFELPFSGFEPLVLVRKAAALLHCPVVSTVACVALVLRKQILYFGGAFREVFSAEDCRTEASVSIHAALAGALEESGLCGVDAIPGSRVVLVPTALRIVRGVA